jgi:hypothetical protein
MRLQQGVFGGVPTTRCNKSFNKLAHTPSLRVSLGQVGVGLGVTGVGVGVGCGFTGGFFGVLFGGDGTGGYFGVLFGGDGWHPQGT